MQGVFEENFKIGTCRAGKSLGFGVSDVCMAMLGDFGAKAPRKPMIISE